MSSTSKRNVLVVGATGKQGQAVISALLSPPPPGSAPVHILAMTRSIASASAKAKALAEAHPDSVTLVEGDLLDPAAFFASRPRGSIAAVFLYTAPGKQSETEQAVPFVDAAARHGVRHVVFSSVDRGGEPASWANPTGIKHFYEKHAVELHLRDGLPAAEGEGEDGDGDGRTPTWTVLRPAAFLDNMNPGMFCALFTAMWSTALAPDRKLQFVGTRDIGLFAARALAQPERWAGRAVSLAGDEMTLAEAQATFRRVVGKELPSTWGVLGRGLMWAVGEVGRMFAWFESEGYGADIEALRREESSLQDFEAWLRESSGWKDEIKK